MKRLSLLFLLTIIATTVIGCGKAVEIVKFDTRPEAPFRGDSVTLYWVVRNATEVTLDDMPVTKDSGNVRVLLNDTKKFSLKATNSNSERTNILTIVARPK